MDAEAAARAALSGEGLVTPKSADGPVEVMRALRLTRRSAIKARDTATNQLHALIITARDKVCQRLEGNPIHQVVVSILSDHHNVASGGYAVAMFNLTRRWKQLDDEAAELKTELERIVHDAAPAGLLDQQGVGPDVAAALMIAAGDSPQRLHSEASFAALCGVSPLDASSGKQQRHRLNRAATATRIWRCGESSSSGFAGTRPHAPTSTAESAKAKHAEKSCDA